MEYIKNNIPNQENTQSKKLALLNISSLKKLIVDVIKESDINKTVETWESDINHLDEEIMQLVKFNEKMKENVQREIENMNKKINSYSKRMDDIDSQIMKNSESNVAEIQNIINNINSIKKSEENLNQ